MKREQAASGTTTVVREWLRGKWWLLVEAIGWLAGQISDTSFWIVQHCPIEHTRLHVQNREQAAFSIQ